MFYRCRVIFCSLLFIFCPNLFSMKNADLSNDFLSTVKEDLFAGADNLQLALISYFDGINDYAQVAKLTTKPISSKNDEELINLLNEGLSNKCAAEKVPVIDFHVNKVVVLPTSGIDSMIRRFVFMANNLDFWQNAEIFVLGNNKHREELLNLEYLKSLPSLFYPAYTEDSIVATKIDAIIRKHLKRTASSEFTHKHGVKLILSILKVLDSNMQTIKKQLKFYEIDQISGKELVQHFFAHHDKNQEVIFVCTGKLLSSAGAAIEKIKPEAKVHYAVSKDLDPIIERKVHQTTPTMQINNLLFQLHRRLNF